MMQTAKDEKLTIMLCLRDGKAKGEKLLIMLS
jgi:hypothetical protein